MTRRQLLAAMTGCAVAKPRAVVMVPKRYAMTQMPSRSFAMVWMDNPLTTCLIKKEIWDAWTSKIHRYDLRHP